MLKVKLVEPDFPLTDKKSDKTACSGSAANRSANVYWLSKPQQQTRSQLNIQHKNAFHTHTTDDMRPANDLSIC